MAFWFYHILNIILLSLNPFTCLCRSGASLHAHKLLSNNHLENLVGAQKGERVNGISELKAYLSYLGYMEKYNTTMNPNQVENQNLFDEYFELSLKKYQKFFGLNSSGILDTHTVSNLQQPRCGMPDLFGDQIKKPNFHYFPDRARWKKRNLTYSFPPNARKDVIRPIQEATSKWSTATTHNITFMYIPDYDKADIKISFQTWDHGDGNYFDGLGHILGHAFAPMDGRLHYDGSEEWVDGVVPGRMDLQTVGLHELGHVLGLEHSDDPSSIMWPIMYLGSRKDLSREDLVGIQLLYGIGK